jgi:hypothetical protein
MNVPDGCPLRMGDGRTVGDAVGAVVGASVGVANAMAVRVGESVGKVATAYAMTAPALMKTTSPSSPSATKIGVLLGLMAAGREP